MTVELAPFTKRDIRSAQTSCDFRFQVRGEYHLQQQASDMKLRCTARHATVNVKKDLSAAAFATSP
eukprot:2291703-Rhodomonas_salina.1